MDLMNKQLDSHKESIEIMVSEKSDLTKELAKAESATRVKDGNGRDLPAPRKSV